jgi:hypothetical protein
MWKRSKLLRNCGRITAIVILLSLLRPSLMFAEQPMEQQPNLSENETRLYTDLEIDLLIDEISEAALAAIEQAAGEAAKAAVLSMVEREAAALREVSHRQAEALRWRLEAEALSQGISQARQAQRKNVLLAVLISTLGGLALGVGGTIAITR